MTATLDVASTLGRIQSAPSFGERANAQVALMEHIQGLSDECAEKDRRAKAAADLLSDALVWLDDRHDNVRDYILEALSALGGER